MNEQIDYSLVGYTKEKINKKHGNKRVMPNTLKCVSDLVVSQV
jgi:hypothetical protein